MCHIMKARFQEEDAGLINCIAENKMGKVEKNLIVTILREMNHYIAWQKHRFISEPPKMSSAFLSKEVMKGEQLTMECPIEVDALLSNKKWINAFRTRLSMSLGLRMETPSPLPRKYK